MAVMALSPLLAEAPSEAQSPSDQTLRQKVLRQEMDSSRSSLSEHEEKLKVGCVGKGPCNLAAVPIMGKGLSDGAGLGRAELAGMNNLQAHVLESLGQSVLCFGPQGNLFFWNACAERMMGWPAVDVIGKPVADFLPADGFGPVWALIAYRMELTGEPWTGQFPCRTRKKESFVGLLTCKALLGNGGVRLGTVVSVVDQEHFLPVPWPGYEPGWRARLVEQGFVSARSIFPSPPPLDALLATVENHRPDTTSPPQTSPPTSPRPSYLQSFSGALGRLLFWRPPDTGEDPPVTSPGSDSSEGQEGARCTKIERFEADLRAGFTGSGSTRQQGDLVSYKRSGTKWERLRVEAENNVADVSNGSSPQEFGEAKEFLQPDSPLGRWGNRGRLRGGAEEYSPERNRQNNASSAESVDLAAAIEQAEGSHKLRKDIAKKPLKSALRSKPTSIQEEQPVTEVPDQQGVPYPYSEMCRPPLAKSISAPSVVFLEPFEKVVHFMPETTHPFPPPPPPSAMSSATSSSLQEEALSYRTSLSSGSSSTEESTLLFPPAHVAPPKDAVLSWQDQAGRSGHYQQLETLSEDPEDRAPLSKVVQQLGQSSRFTERPPGVQSALVRTASRASSAMMGSTDSEDLREKLEKEQHPEEDPGTLGGGESRVVLARLGSSAANLGVAYEIPWDQIKLGDKIGEGSSATVYHGMWNGSDVAVKVFPTDDLREDLLTEFKKEVAILLRVRHPNVLLFMGAVVQPPLAIVTEVLPRGSLYRLLHQAGKEPLNEKVRLRLALDTARGMNYLHQLTPPIVHRDLKSLNVLVDKNWTAKVADMGLSRIKHATYISSRTGGGTPEWMAPEILRSEPSNEKSDVYSFGVILWELITSRRPWSGMSVGQIIGAVGFQDQRLEIPESADPTLALLIRDCWKSVPKERPSFEEIGGVLKGLLKTQTGQSQRSPHMESLSAS